MQIKKRSGKLESVDLNKITVRIQNLLYIDGIDTVPLNVDPILVAKKVVSGLYDGVTSSELDSLASEISASLISLHPDYNKLAARIEVSSLHKETLSSFSAKFKLLCDLGICDKQLLDVIDMEYCDLHINYLKDYNIDFFGIKTLKKSYLLKDNTTGKIIERPQDMWMRVSSFIHQDSKRDTKISYKLMSDGFFTHATPTLFNAGTIKPQLSSCFLLDMNDDSIVGIYKTLTDCAKISQSAGGIGMSIHKIRSKDSPIKGTNGVSNGIVPMLKVFDSTARYVDQCFNGDTLVYTDIGAQPFKLLNESRKVVTNDGSLQKINKVVKHKDEKRDSIKISVKKSIRPIEVTEAHPFLCLKNQKIGLNHSVIKNRIKKKLIVPSWEDAKDLSAGDFIAFPIPKVNIDSLYSEEDFWFYGLLLGDGSIPNNNFNGFTVHINSKESHIVKKLIGYCDSRGIKYNISENGGRFRFRGNSSPKNPFKREHLYRNKEKYFLPDFQLLPKEKSLSILKGLMDSDGYFGKKELLLEMSSRQVIEGVRFMLLRLGVLTSGYDRNRIGNVSSYKNIKIKKKTICLRVPKEKLITDYFNIPNGRSTNQFVYNNCIWTRINNIEKSKNSGLVYDLEVNNNHNYLTEIGLCHNGGGKRKGSIAVYVEPWHKDIFEFLDLKKNHGKEEMRARDLFYAMWIPDLFMQRVEDDADWTLFDPNVTDSLSEYSGDEFEKRYTALESKGLGETRKAREIWNRIIESQIETGTPYMLYKDAANEKSNQKNLGTIKSSNLCTEIIEYTSPMQTAVCNLASIGLPKFINTDNKTFNLHKLYEITKIVTKNLNKVIDLTYYPVLEALHSNNSHRPIGIGVQGLADCFAILGLPFESSDARKLNKQIFEAIYKGSLDASIELAKELGSYTSYKGSPISKGILQFDMWGIDRNDLHFNWSRTFRDLKRYGVRNSLLVAPMPTASTSQILGNNECFEPFTSNIYVRRTLSGEFVVVNKHLVNDLMSLNLWTEEIKNKIISDNGSVQNIAEIPDNLKQVYKTVWEMSMKSIIEMAADRGPFICQSQSMNLFVESPTLNKLSSMHFYAWKKGLKTGMYYLRSKAASSPIKITVRNNTKETSQFECVGCGS